jgi:iron complex transport system permease protein
MSTGDLNLPPPVTARLARALAVLAVLLAGSAALGLWLGTEKLDLTKISSNPTAEALFFQLRLPRVLTGALIGAALAATGAALQALFRNPLADPYALGVSCWAFRSSTWRPSEAPCWRWPWSGRSPVPA